MILAGSMRVSVIIAAKNEAERIGSCLDSVLSQTYKDYGVIVVDDGSTDDTPRIVKSYEEKSHGKVRIVSSPSRGPGYARNIGVESSSGDILAFIDGDDEIDSEYLEKVMRNFEDPMVAGVFVRMVFRSPMTWGRVQDAWKEFRSRKEITRFPTVIRRSIFMEVKGYDGRLVIGEDYDFFMKVKRYVEENGLKLCTEDRAIIYCVSEGSPSKIFKHGIWFGENLVQTLKHDPSYGSPIFLWSLFNAILLPILLFLFLPPLQILIMIYLSLYLIIWIAILTKAVLLRGVKSPVCYVLLTPILQLWIGLGITIGIAISVIRSGGEFKSKKETM